MRLTGGGDAKGLTETVASHTWSLAAYARRGGVLDGLEPVAHPEAMVPRWMVVLGAWLGSTGCQPAIECPIHPPPNVNALVARASFDLGCEPQRLTVLHFGGRVYGVRGCGRRLTYIDDCARRAECNWRLDAPRPDQLTWPDELEARRRASAPPTAPQKKDPVATVPGEQPVERPELELVVPARPRKYDPGF